MSDKSLDLNELKAIVDWVGVTEDVREFSLKFGETELFVSRNGTASAPMITATPAPAAPASAATPAPTPTPTPAPAPTAFAPVTAPASVGQLAADEVLIKAPMVGTFYASPKPGAPVFVSVGDTVKADTVLCIVEVMKLMNNIEAGVTGTVTKVLVQNEEAVEYGQPLMVIRTAA